jgi:hypothetical protein
VLQDEIYIARDTQHQSPRSERATIAASLILRDNFYLHKSIPNLKDVLLHEYFFRNTVNGIDSALTPSNLQYDAAWLETSSAIFSNMWCSLHRCLATASSDVHVYDTMTWLCTMAYAESADMNVIQALAALYRDSSFSAIHIPSALTFKLVAGTNFSQQEVHSVIQRNLLSFDDSAESRLPKQNLETDHQHIKRIEGLFNTNQGAAIESFILELQQQWPMRRPSTPTSSAIHKYVRVATAMETITVKFEDWYNNREFHQYLDQISRHFAHQTVLPIDQPRYILSAPIKQKALSYRLRQWTPEELFATVTPCITPQCK